MSLDDTFLIDGGGLSPYEMTEIILDEVNTLDTVIRLSLEAYQSLMSDVGFIDIKDRVKHLEVADKYLKTATDAMYKKESLTNQRSKGKQPQSDGVIEPEEVGMSRDELYERRRQKINGGK